MNDSIFERSAEEQVFIKQVLEPYKETKEWQQAKAAFEQIISRFFHGEETHLTDEEIEHHFEQALVITKEDVQKYQGWIDQLLANKEAINSPYYLINSTHARKDEFYTPNQHPITGTGNQTLKAKFEALNIYQKYQINALTKLPDRLSKKTNCSSNQLDKFPFRSWETTTEVMTDISCFHDTFGLTDKAQEDEIFSLVSNWDWKNEVQADLYLTPELALNEVFSPALFAVYLFRATPDAPKNVFMIISADGKGVAQAPFIGIINPPQESKQKIYHSTSRSNFTYLSTANNLMSYWIDMKDEEKCFFTLGIETFYPEHPKHPYIEVTTDFCAKVPEASIEVLKHKPLFKTFLMLIKGTLMKDLVQAYYPNSSSVQLWEDIGALKRIPIIDELLAKGLDVIADIFDVVIWKYKPYAWQNWHNTIGVGGPAQRCFEPNNGVNVFSSKTHSLQSDTFNIGLKRLVTIVKDAMQSDETCRIRAFGSKWSLNNCAYTKDFMVKTWGLNYAKFGLDREMVTPNYHEKKNRLCFVQAGVMIHDLNKALQDRLLALKTTGASDGQRLVGAISAGTHGSAMGVGAMQDYVKGIHLVIPDGDNNAKHVFLQRQSDQVVTSNFANFLDHTEIINDDALFNAAVVSFGCFGLIHGLLIETEPLFLLKHQTVRFNLNCSEYTSKLQAVLAQPTRKNLRALAKKGVSDNLFNWLKEEEGYPYFFSVNYNPYKGLFPRTFFVEVMEKIPCTHSQELFAAVQKEPFRKHEKHEAVYHGMKKHLHKNRKGRLYKSLLSDGLQIGIELFQGKTKIPMNAANSIPDVNLPNVVFSTKNATNVVTTSPCPATSTEIAVPIGFINKAFDCIREVLQTSLLAAPLGIRYLPKTLATLGMNQYDDFTVTIELPGPQKGDGVLCSLFPDAEVAHQAIFEALDKAGIPHCFHWGQQYPLNKQWVSQSYGIEKIEAWKAARARLLTSSKAQQLFSNEQTDAIGLT